MQLEDIAIIGLACRFPGARTLNDFWRNLCAGRDSSTELSDAEAIAAGVPEAVLAQPSYLRTAYAVEGADEFDARFFGVHPDEARLMDPQQRLQLEVGYAALEDAGQVKRAQRCTTSVFASAGGVATSYLLNLADRFAEHPHGTGSLAHLVNDKDFLATRLSFKLGLTGPSLSVQTACSSSLVAVHLARMSLLVGESELAVVGASCIRVPLRAGYVAAENPVLSPTGKCKAFSDDADGTIFGSGVGAVVLKRYSEALRDRDNIYAVLKSTATTNDGAAKIGYTASSVPGQAKAMIQAITAAGVKTRDLSYIEAHGTATKIGDPLEMKALERVFRLDTEDRQFCGIGSVKPNIGHLEQAAGLASLIKLALMLKHRTLVPSIHFRNPNPKIDFERSPFFVVRETQEWSPRDRADGAPLVAGLNCLGIGGTNAFAVLAEAPLEATRRASVVSRTDTSQHRDLDQDIVCVSARTHEQLCEYLDRLADFLDDHPGTRTRDFCYTVNVSRSHHRVRFSGLMSGELATSDVLRAGRARPAPPEVLPPKQPLYVCNPVRTVAAETVAAFASDPRLPVFRARHEALSTRLRALRPNPSDRLAEQLRTLAFEVALHAQLSSWGVTHKDVLGVGFGRLVEKAIEASGKEDGLAELLLELDDEGAVASAWEHPEPSSDPRFATHHIVRRAARPNEAKLTGTQGTVLDEVSSPLSSEGLLLFLTRHLELGRDIDWEQYYCDGPVQMISLPTYPFARDRHWLGR